MDVSTELYYVGITLLGIAVIVLAALNATATIRAKDRIVADSEQRSQQLFALDNHAVSLEDLILSTESYGEGEVVVPMNAIDNLEKTLRALTLTFHAPAQKETH